MIPCSIEAFEHLDEMYLEGKSKFNEELTYAKSIPPNQRRLIDQNFLMTLETAQNGSAAAKSILKNVPANQEEEVIAEHYDKYNLYFK